ncbi:MAG: hypothetical protein ACI4JI_06875 [Ruminiclostridium sp.]
MQDNGSADTDIFDNAAYENAYARTATGELCFDFYGIGMPCGFRGVMGDFIMNCRFSAGHGALHTFLCADGRNGINNGSYRFKKSAYGNGECKGEESQAFFTA